MERHARFFAFGVLAAVTAYGIERSVSGDLSRALSHWGHPAAALAILVGLNILDVLLDLVLWRIVCAQFGLQVNDRVGLMVFLSGYAGLLVPAQLGRLVRPDALARLGRAELGVAVKAEGFALFLAAVAAVGLLAALVAWVLSPLLALPAGAAAIAAALFAADRAGRFAARTRLSFAPAELFRPRTFALVLFAMIGWVLHGVGLYAVVRGLPGNASLLAALIAAPGAALLGTSTGLPGGVGAIEGLLGLSLRTLMEIPPEHLALAVGSFRLVTFWMWLPVGWFALGALKLRLKSLKSRRTSRTHAPG